MSASYIQALSGQRYGKYAEYFVKLELTQLGYDIYTPEVDDRGIDFIARKADTDSVEYLEIQVKAVRSRKGSTNYPFIRKSKLRLVPNVFIALVIARNEHMDVFLIPSTVWLTPDDLFISRDYEDGSSAPEWGIRFAKDRMQRLFDQFSLSKGCPPTLPSPTRVEEASGA